MENQVSISDFSVDYVAPKITINNQEQLAEEVAEYANKFKGLIVTAATLKDSKNTRAELNKLKKALDDRRKEIKKLYNVPLKKFETTVKGYIAQIDEVNADIDSGIKQLEELEKENRLNHVKDLIAEMSPNFGVGIDEIEIDPHWLIKTISEKKIIDGIAGTMNSIKAEKAKRETDIKLVETQCKMRGLESSGWLELVGIYDALEICKQIDEKADEIEHQKKVEEEIKKANLEAEKEKLVQIDDTNLDIETGEVVKELQIVSFKMKGTKEQLDEIARYIANSSVEVISASERETVLER